MLCYIGVWISGLGVIIQENLDIFCFVFIMYIFKVNVLKNADSIHVQSVIDNMIFTSYLDKS